MAVLLQDGLLNAQGLAFLIHRLGRGLGRDDAGELGANLVARADLPAMNDGAEDVNLALVLAENMDDELPAVGQGLVVGDADAAGGEVDHLNLRPVRGMGRGFIGRGDPAGGSGPVGAEGDLHGAMMADPGGAAFFPGGRLGAETQGVDQFRELFGCQTHARCILRPSYYRPETGV